MPHPHPPDIALFIRSLQGGGAERVLLHLAQGFTERGLSVDLLLPRKTGPYLKQVPPEVRIIDLESPQVLRSLPKLAKYLKQEKPTALLAALHYPAEIALWAKRLVGGSTRIVVSERNTLSVEAKNTQQLSVKLSPLAARLFYPWADGITAVSQGVADDLANITQLPADKIKVIYNPTITPKLIEKSQATIEHPWFAPGQPPVILGVGRLHPQKDFSTLIRAFAKVRAQRPANLMVLGAGPEEALLRETIESLDLGESVELPGFVQNPYAYMRQASVFVLSSAWEGCANVLMEALAIGTPVVATDCPSGPAEILAGGQYGLLTPVGDSEAMATAIVKTLSTDAQRADPAWLSQFTLETCVQKYLEVLGFA